MCDCRKKKKPEPTPMIEEYIPQTPQDFFENAEYVEPINENKTDDNG